MLKGKLKLTVMTARKHCSVLNFVSVLECVCCQHNCIGHFLSLVVEILGDFWSSFSFVGVARIKINTCIVDLRISEKMSCT